MIDKKLAFLGLKEDETKVFLFLIENAGQTAGNIAKKTGLSRPSLYGFLKNLQEKGLVIESRKDGVKVFSVTSQDKINLLMDEKIKEITNTKQAIENVFLEIRKGVKPSVMPRFQIFEGKEEMKNIPRDLLLYRNIKGKSYWPIKDMLRSLGEDFFEEFNKERVRRGIYIEAIWPENQVVSMDDYPFMGTGEKFIREIRIAPKDINFSMGYWIYENKVSFVSSQKDNFGFIIESKEFADMISSQFDVVWKLSKKIKITKEKSDKLFEKMNIDS